MAWLIATAGRHTLGLASLCVTVALAAWVVGRWWRFACSAVGHSPGLHCCNIALGRQRVCTCRRSCRPSTGNYRPPGSTRTVTVEPRFCSELNAIRLRRVAYTVCLWRAADHRLTIGTNVSRPNLHARKNDDFPTSTCCVFHQHLRRKLCRNDDKWFVACRLSSSSSSSLFQAARPISQYVTVVEEFY